MFLLELNTKKYLTIYENYTNPLVNIDMFYAGFPICV